MEADRFDILTRSLSSRRGAIGLGALLGLSRAISTSEIAAKAGKKGKKRKKCRGAKTKCGRGCCVTTGTKPDCCPSAKGKACTNLASDPANCGSCGFACPTGQVCAGGLCWDPCPEASGCFAAKLCQGDNLCVAVNGVAVCAVGGSCFALTDCSNDPTACSAGAACADICCGNASKTCRTPA